MKKIIAVVLFGLFLSQSVHAETNSILYWITSAACVVESHQFATRAANADSQAGWIRDREVMGAKTWFEYHNSLDAARQMEKKAQIRRQYRDIYLSAAVVSAIGALLEMRFGNVVVKPGEVTTVGLLF